MSDDTEMNSQTIEYNSHYQQFIALNSNHRDKKRENRKIYNNYPGYWKMLNLFIMDTSQYIDPYPYEREDMELGQI